MIILIRQKIIFFPQQVLLDFEIGAIRAFQIELPGIDIGACLFHFCKTIHDFVKHKLRITKVEYESAPELTTHIERLTVLPFVPEEHVTTHFNELMRRCPHRLNQLFRHVQTNYVGFRKPDGNWHHPRFPQAWWNVAERTGEDSTDSTRTTNNNESFHRQYSYSHKDRRPPLRLFLDVLLHEQEHSDTLLARAHSCVEPKKRAVKEQDRFDAMKRIVEHFDPAEDVDRYLDRILIWLSKFV